MPITSSSNQKKIHHQAAQKVNPAPYPQYDLHHVLEHVGQKNQTSGVNQQSRLNQKYLAIPTSNDDDHSIVSFSDYVHGNGHSQATKILPQTIRSAQDQQET